MMLNMGTSYYLWHDQGPEDLLAALSNAKTAVEPAEFHALNSVP